MKKAPRPDRPETEDLYEFERFLQVFGFKRTESALYGFLVLCESPVTADEIGRALNLSQGAISQGLKNLSLWGGIESRYDSTKGAQVHIAVQDSTKIVATIFKKREQEAIASLKNVVRKILDRFLEQGDSKTHPRILRLQSIILTCETAESVIEFILSLSTIADQKKIHAIVKALPKTFGLLVREASAASALASRIKNALTSPETQGKWH